MSPPFTRLALLFAACLTGLLPLPGLTAPAPTPPLGLSGIYPHLAMFNAENECGTGAVVPWANRLWVVTYAPHAPTGSSDRLYEITRDLRQIVRPESIGGTPANRMIHPESAQLFIGPYAIDASGHVRVIPYSALFGRPTGNARHLTDPEHRLYGATMEEGLYEIDVRTLAVTELWTDEQRPAGRHANLPGYHGKGLYSAQGRLIYANNGEHGDAALHHPETTSGVLAEWDGHSAAWTVIRRNQFTEVTGPGGLRGNADAVHDPAWSIGWDHRSLILMVLADGAWHAYRLPKSSHSYDGAHGWNTEWPRIRDIGERDLLMTMHGAFWRFPRNFAPRHASGLVPRSNYLKVIGDFTEWQGRLVFGCDDTARAEFLNQRKAKGKLAAPQSQSNLWFVEPRRLDHLGPVLGRGGPWVREDVPAGTVTEPFLATGYDHRWLHLAHEGSEPVRIHLEIDRRGDGRWLPARTFRLPPHGYLPVGLAESATWVRLRTDQSLARATAWFHFSDRDRRRNGASPLFAGLAQPNSRPGSAGVIRALADNRRTLGFAARFLPSPDSTPRELGYYELDDHLALRPIDDPATLADLRSRTAIPAGVLQVDEASVLFVDDSGRRWRLPKGDPALDHEGAFGPVRVDREVATERDLFNAHGTFYELPAENAGGFAKVRPIATHDRRIHDYCSYRGLLILSGIDADAPRDNPHLIRAADGRAALWAGALDDLWQLGKPRGRGGPWNGTPVRAGVPSDPYLLTGYDRKTLTLAHDAPTPTAFHVEVDVNGEGLWCLYAAFVVPAGRPLTHRFPPGYGAYWLRVTATADLRATAQLLYE